MQKELSSLRTRAIPGHSLRPLSLQTSFSFCSELYILQLITGCWDLITGYNKARGCYFHTSCVGFILDQLFYLFLRAYLIRNNTFYRLVLFYAHNPFLHYKRWLEKTWWEFYKVLFIAPLVSKSPKRYSICLFSFIPILLTPILFLTFYETKQYIFEIFTSLFAKGNWEEISIRNTQQMRQHGMFLWGHKPFSISCMYNFSCFPL